MPSKQPDTFRVNSRPRLYALSSAMIHGVGKDVERIVKAIAPQSRQSGFAASQNPVAVAIGETELGSQQRRKS